MTTKSRVIKAVEGGENEPDADYATRRYDTWLRSGRGLDRFAIETVAQKVTSSNNASGQGRIRPSLIGKCPRKQVLSYFNAEKDPHDIDLLRIFQIGHILHKHWQEVGMSEGWLTDVEVPLVIPSAGVTGSADGILDDGSIFELKTCSNYMFDKLTDAPYEEHFLQVQLYMHALDARKASIVYINKDLSRKFPHKEFRVTYDPAVFSKEIMPDILDICGYIQSSEELAAATGEKDYLTLPPVNEEHRLCKVKKGNTYEWCEFRTACAPELED